MKSYLFPLRYLKLEGAQGNLLIRRDIVPIVLIVTVLSVPFILVTEANYAHEGGFLDRLGSFCAVLTGFYFAGLIAVASLSSNFADLDKVISVGEVRAPSVGDQMGDALTRREYVCYMFSYLSFLSILLSAFAIFVVIISPEIEKGPIIFESFVISRELIRAVGVVCISLPTASLMLTTLRGLYYLAERLYDEAPSIDNSKSPSDPS